ncbi:hypothetical protein FKW77_006542 [Venturia effusa]|uniref:Uncharacterized protein n=1 Tax=Venturia effusa TaxID=50376 RepID=A0A517LN13_9PEZI|nr:hypothetical protein FKW77_006542 [Venturia effusa]
MTTLGDMTSTIGVTSEMHHNLSDHKTARAREIYLRRICRDLDIRSTVMEYENFQPEPEFQYPQLAPQLQEPEAGAPVRRRPDPTKPDPPVQDRQQSKARIYLHEKRDIIKYDFDKETMRILYIRDADKNEVTTVPHLVEDWTLWPPPACKNTKEKEWQIRFRKQAQPLLKLSACLNMPVEQSEIFFAHYPIDNEFKKPLALFAGAAVLIPHNGAGVPEPGTMAMISKALRDLARAGTKKGMRMKVVPTPYEKEIKEEQNIVLRKQDGTWVSMGRAWLGEVLQRMGKALVD